MVSTPDFRIVKGAEDITEKLRPSFQSLVLYEEKGDQSDRLELVLSAFTATLKDQPLTVALGTKEAGVIKQGVYRVEEIMRSSPPRRLRITASSIGLLGRLKERKTRTFTEKTLRDIVGEIAVENDLKLEVAPQVPVHKIEHIVQDNETELAFLKRLAEWTSLVIRPQAPTPDKGKIIIMPHESVSLKGEPLPEIALKTEEILSVEHRAVGAPRYGAVEARWWDIEAAAEKVEKAGTGTPIYRLPTILESQKEAHAQAESKLSALRRKGQSLRVTILGRGDIFALSPMRLDPPPFSEASGLWLVSKVTQRLSAGAGWRTEIEAEVPQRRRG